MSNGRARKLSGLDEALTVQPDLRDIVLGVVRDGHLLRVGAPEADAIEASDRLLYVRHAGH